MPLLTNSLGRNQYAPQNDIASIGEFSVRVKSGRLRLRAGRHCPTH